MSNDLDLIPDAGGLSIYQPAPTPVDYSGLPVPDALPSPWVPDASEHTAAPVVFGQRLPAGVTHEAAQRGLAALENHFAQAMHQQGVAQHFTNAARAWFRQAARGPAPGAALPAHPYSLYGYSFSQADEPLLNSFLNYMYRSARAPEAVVAQFLRTYQGLVERLPQQRAPATRQPSPGNTLDDLTDAEYEYVMRRADADARAGRDELRTRWGSEFAPRLRVVRQYFAGLPAQERDYLESAVTQGGVLAANSPDFIDRMYHQAIGGMPTGGALQAEIASLESRMKTNRRAWDRDERAQLRLRELYRLRG